jgi:hypothetical protein
MLAASDIRRRWRGVVALTVLVGAVGVIVLATAAGARRSDAALGRFNTFSRTSDLEISVGFPTAAQLRTFRRTPEVAAMARLLGYSLTIAAYPELAVAAPLDGAFGDVVDRSRLISGRRANPSAPDEITIGEALAGKLHLRVGSHFDMQSYTPRQIVIGFSGGNQGDPAGPRVRLRVVGIVRRPLDLGVRATAGGVVALTPAFNAEFEGRVGLYTEVLRVRTRAGKADIPRVVAKARAMFGRAQAFGVQPLGIETEGAHNAIDVLTLALWIFAGVTALAGAVAIGIVLTRDISSVAVDQSTLRALGTTRGQRIAAIGSRALIIAGAGASLALIGALCASPRFPLGIARRADPDVGFHADWVVLAVGIAVIAGVVLAVAFLAAWRATRPVSSDRARARRRTSPIVELAARAGLRPAATNGLRMALQAGSGESSVPVRSAFAGAVFGVAGITAVLVFAASLAHLVSTPRLSGWTWDLKTEVPTTAGVACVDSRDHGLARTPGIEAVAAVCPRDVQIDGRPVTTWGIRQLRGTIAPEVVAGRAPRGPGEIALGSVTLHAARKNIGDTVNVRGETGARNFRIVGRIVLPAIGSPQPLADGASVTAAGFAPILSTANGSETHFLIARFAPGADRAAIERGLAAIAPTERLRNIGGPTTAVEVGRVQQINWFPAILAAVLAALALLAVGHALVTSVRRRRRELALLKTIGFGRRQVGATVAWQATTIAAVGLVVGIPAGLVVGRAVWRQVADGLGVSTGATMPTLMLILTVFAALVLVNLVAFFPARNAARTRPAVALRSE